MDGLVLMMGGVRQRCAVVGSDAPPVFFFFAGREQWWLMVRKTNQEKSKPAEACGVRCAVPPHPSSLA